MRVGLSQVGSWRTSVTPLMSDRGVRTTMAVSPQSPPIYNRLSLNSASSSCTVDLIWDTCATHNSTASDGEDTA